LQDCRCEAKRRLQGGGIAAGDRPVEERLTAYNQERGTTLVVIEHNMEFVMSLCTRIIVLAEGAIIAEGSPDEVRSNQSVIDAYLGG
jgi:branched-chain amino acid transport system ATP-binding protein